MADSHVFVTMGSVTRLACDAWLLPGDHSREPVTSTWLEQVPGLEQSLAATSSDGFKRGGNLALPLAGWPLGKPLPVLTAVPLSGPSSAHDLIPAVSEFIHVAARQSRIRRLPPAVHIRPRPLLAMPLFGTGDGGADLFRGEVIQQLLEESRNAGEKERVDVALVLRDERDFALAQKLRKREGIDWWRELDEALRAQVTKLSGEARRGRLVPFMGSGVSVSAGAPDWKTLIQHLAVRIGMSSAEQEALKSRNLLDQAGILQTLYQERYPEVDSPLNEAIASEMLRLEYYGLAPALLAGLPAKQAITLNYDNLFECASADSGKSVTVIPEEEAKKSDRWLLKLHGTVTNPSTIVLTRDDYLGYSTNREALSALVKATLMTHHLLFVGFGLADDHFHEIVHDVRRALPAELRKDSSLATALTLFRDELDERAWKDKLALVPMSDGYDTGEAARTLEIFLDMLLSYATDSHSYFLASKYEEALTPPEVSLRNKLLTLLENLSDEELATSGGGAVIAMMNQLGPDENSIFSTRFSTK